MTQQCAGVNRTSPRRLRSDKHQAPYQVAEDAALSFWRSLSTVEARFRQILHRGLAAEIKKTSRWERKGTPYGGEHRNSSSPPCAGVGGVA